MDVDFQEEQKRLRSRYGHILFTRLMEFLTSDRGLWKNASECLMHGQPHDGCKKRRKVQGGPVQDAAQGQGPQQPAALH